MNIQDKLAMIRAAVYNSTSILNMVDEILIELNGQERPPIKLPTEQDIAIAAGKRIDLTPINRRPTLTPTSAYFEGARFVIDAVLELNGIVGTRIEGR